MVKALSPGKGGPLTPLIITETPIGQSLPPFQGTDEDRDKVINKQWKKESKGNNQLKTIVSGGGGGPSGGPGPDGNGTRDNGNDKEQKRRKATKGGGVDWGKWRHRAAEAAMYGSGAAYGRYRYREWKEEGALSEGRAQQMAKDVLGDSIQEDTSEESYYDILGIPPTATTRGVQNAFNKLALEWHPDRNKRQDAEETFRKIKEAYDTLKDPARRDAYDKAQAERRAGPGWKDLPGSYQKKFRGQARKQLRTEKQVYSEARRLGIPLESPVMRQWDQMSGEEKTAARKGLGLGEDEDPAASTRARMAFPVGKGKKSVAQLAHEIETYKKGMATTKAERGLAEGAARDAAPDKRKKATQYAGKAAGFIGRVGSSAGATGVGRKVRGQEAGGYALMDLQAGGTGKLKGPVAMGAGSLRGAISGGGPQRAVPGSQSVAGLMTAPREELQAVSAPPRGGRDLKAAVGGSDRISQSIRIRTSRGTQSPLTRAGGPATRKRLAYSGKTPITSSGRRQIRGL